MNSRSIRTRSARRSRRIWITSGSDRNHPRVSRGVPQPCRLRRLPGTLRTPRGRRRLLAGLLLLARHDSPGVADVAAIPAREWPIGDDPGIRDHLDEDVEEGDRLEALALVIADLA